MSVPWVRQTHLRTHTHAQQFAVHEASEGETGVHHTNCLFLEAFRAKDGGESDREVLDYNSLGKNTGKREESMRDER